MSSRHKARFSWTCQCRHFHTRGGELADYTTRNYASSPALVARLTATLLGGQAGDNPRARVGAGSHSTRPPQSRLTLHTGRRAPTKHLSRHHLAATSTSHTPLTLGQAKQSSARSTVAPARPSLLPYTTISGPSPVPPFTLALHQPQLGAKCQLLLPRLSSCHPPQPPPHAQPSRRPSLSPPPVYLHRHLHSIQNFGPELSGCPPPFLLIPVSSPSPPNHL
ncbi:hypothetical protein O3P69_004096 [Scylla paramamosain]|uniref:Uncharacterized protein n=1 Tax=Scylla paramamosain TaxID=85552 RepID=A0AAW0UKN2_SCYPA